MKTVNIVTENGNWILKRIAKELEKRNDWKISKTTDPNAYVNYYVNYALVVGSPKISGFKAGFFTHFDPDYSRNWRIAEKECQLGVYMANRYRPNTRYRRKIYPTGIDVKPRKFRIGVVGRLYSNGRKGENEIQQMLLEINENYDKRDVQVVALGDTSWRRIGIYDITNWESDIQAMKWYNSIDVLYCASSLEGGPVPVLECVKLQKNVIVGDIGNSEDWKSFVFLKNNTNDRLHTLHELINNHFQRNDLRRENWQIFAERHFEFFKNFIK